jgi:hypothetical protein
MYCSVSTIINIIGSHCHDILSWNINNFIILLYYILIYLSIFISLCQKHFDKLAWMAF